MVDTREKPRGTAPPERTPRRASRRDATQAAPRAPRAAVVATTRVNSGPRETKEKRRAAEGRRVGWGRGGRGGKKERGQGESEPRVLESGRGTRKGRKGRGESETREGGGSEAARGREEGGGEGGRHLGSASGQVRECRHIRYSGWRCTRSRAVLYECKSVSARARAYACVRTHMCVRR